MHRRLLLALMAALLALTMLPSAGSAQEPPSGYVAPCFGGELWTAAPGEPIHFLCGWGVQGGPGKIVSFLTSHRGTLTVRDEDDDVVLSFNPDQLAALWAEPNPP
jgi:hypothetical protein